MLYLPSVSIASLWTCFQLHFHRCGATRIDFSHTICLRGQHGNTKPVIRPVRYSSHCHQFNELQNKAHSQLVHNDSYSLPSLTRATQIQMLRKILPRLHQSSRTFLKESHISYYFSRDRFSLHCFPVAKAIIPGPRATRANGGCFFFWAD